MAGDNQVRVQFQVGEAQYECDLKSFDIIHDGIHHAIPESLRRGKKLIIRSQSGDDIYPDMFAGEVVESYGENGVATLQTQIEPITSSPGEWCNIGFDHLAVTVANREAAYKFFTEVLKMQEMRHDEHLTVLATGHTALFLFDTGEDVPLSDGLPSRWHHLGFVVDNLEHAFHHLEQFEQLVSDFTLLERQERWSLYGHYRNGDVTFMIQLSEIRDGWRGFEGGPEFADYLYDYTAQRYGRRLI